MTVTLVPFTSGGGARIMARDLTEERFAQATLTKAEVRLREAQELSHVGLWLWDAASDELQISDELYRIHGLSPLEFQRTMLRGVAQDVTDRKEAAEALRDQAALIELIADADAITALLESPAGLMPKSTH